MPNTHRHIHAQWWTTWGFWLRVLALSLLSSPVLCAQERFSLPAPLRLRTFAQQPVEQPTTAALLPQELPAPLVEAPLEPEASVVVPPVPLRNVTESVAQPWSVGDACAPNYWIVSSRCSIQNIHDCGRWGLDAYHRQPDGQMQREEVARLAAQLTPGIPVCIFVHGSFVKWESQCREAEQAYRAIRKNCPGMPVQMIFYTWPSDGPYTYLLPLDVAVRGERADFNGFHLNWLISQLPPECPVCLIGHSHGTRAVLSTLHLAAGGEIQGHRFALPNPPRRYRAILAAAAMDNEWLNPGQQYDCALSATECLLHLRNRCDLPLALYPLSRPFAGRALARAGFTRRDVRKLGPQAEKIRECDVTAYLGHDHLWPDYFSEVDIVCLMSPYIYFQ